MTLADENLRPGKSSTHPLRTLQVDPEALAMVPRRFAVEHGVLAFARSPHRLRVISARPLAAETFDALACLTGLEILPSEAEASEVAAAIARCYGAAPETVTETTAAEAIADFSGERETELDSASSADTNETDAPIIALVHGIIHEAIRRRASDIHIEPLKQRLRVRYRIDGALLEVENPPKPLQRAIVSRIKIMADISIAEKRLPQDGRIQINANGRALDLRVSVIPSTYGESVVMRVLNKENLRPGLAELGFFDDDRQTFERLIALPDGIVLVTGPTGSGKTTTLYSCLHQLNRPGLKVITVEDPVEYQLSGVNQVPVRQEIGMTFAAALRAMLRQAPNIVMVGEIRDGETAEIALQAALTGHLVFSTLHTNDAVGAITRLLDLGAKPFLVASSLRAVLAQRLVRRICPACVQVYRPDGAELRALGSDAAKFSEVNFKRGSGCPACDGTGYSGRLVICELLELNDELQAMIHSGASTAQLRTRATELGLRSMRQDGLRKIKAGLTTVEEVVSITVGDSR